ncbi:aminoglycoside phosphotransferase family protein [Wukongibacter baidiensis]|uniref:phosphotransferase family protein n=1 Tax=Wukongibacter baidiensis TaxID=1723361 RepID=UPI003D7F6C34
MSIGKLIGEGRTAEVYEWGCDRVLKLYKKGIKRNIIENEFRASKEILKVDIPAPEVFELIEYEDRLGIISERVYGHTMIKSILLKPWRMVNEAKRLAEIHKRIQKKIDVDLPRQKNRLKKQIESTDLLVEDIKEKIYKYLEKLSDDNILCHGDFHPDNILISKNKEIVIDWMDAAIGNPAADVARTSILFKYGSLPDDKSLLERKVVDFVRRKFYSEYIKHYTEICNISTEEIEVWELPIAAARLVEDIPECEKAILIDYINKRIK